MSDLLSSDLLNTIPSNKLNNGNRGRNSHKTGKLKTSIKNIRMTVKGEEKSKSESRSISKNHEIKKINKKNYSHIEDFLKNISKDSRKISDYQIPLKSNGNIKSGDIRIVLKLFDHLSQLLTKVSKIYPEIPFNDLLVTLFRVLGQSSKAHREELCRNTIMELLKADYVKLKSRKHIMVNNCKMEKFIFMKQIKQSTKSPKHVTYKSDLLESSLSFSLYELSTKEYIHATREIVGSAVTDIYEKTNMFTASNKIMPSSTAELLKIEIIPNGCLSTDNGISEMGKTNFDLPALDSVKNYPEVILDDNPNENYKIKESIYNIYPFLESIESLKKPLPIQLLESYE